MQDMQVQSLGQKDPLEKKMVIHSRVLTWEIPWTEEPGGLQSTGLQTVRHNLVTEQQQHIFINVLSASYVVTTVSGAPQTLSHLFLTTVLWNWH